MNIVCVYHPENGSFEVYGHDLDDSQAKALVKKLRTRGVGSEIIPQSKQHRSGLETCGYCQSEVEAYYDKQRQIELLSKPPERPLSLGQGTVSSRVEKQSLIDLNQGAWPRVRKAVPYAAGIILFVFILALGANPIAQKVVPALQTLLQHGVQTTESALQPVSTDRIISLVESTEAPTETQPVSVPTTPLPALIKTATPLPKPTSTTIPTAAPLPSSITPSPLPSPTSESNCRPYTGISIADVGNEVCVTGTAARTSDKQGIFYVFFDDQVGSFYLVSYEGAGKKIKPGDCLMVTGPVKQVGTRPVILLTWTMEIQTCQ